MFFTLTPERIRYLRIEFVDEATDDLDAAAYRVRSLLNTIHGHVGDLARWADDGGPIERADKLASTQRTETAP
jgi:hypothetical protein